MAFCTSKSIVEKSERVKGNHAEVVKMNIKVRVANFYWKTYISASDSERGKSGMDDLFWQLLRFLKQINVKRASGMIKFLLESV